MSYSSIIKCVLKNILTLFWSNLLLPSTVSSLHATSFVFLIEKKTQLPKILFSLQISKRFSTLQQKFSVCFHLISFEKHTKMIRLIDTSSPVLTVHGPSLLFFLDSSISNSSLIFFKKYLWADIKI